MPETISIEPEPLDEDVRIANIQSEAQRHRLAIDSEVAAMLAQDAAVGFGASGGKDSDAMALATTRFLDAVGHQGPRVLIHADLGQIEHADSLPQCERLAARCGLELIVVRRQSGGMLERWEQRWRDNAARYINLECVTLITPWSSAAMRFCTSELKVAPITRNLAIRFHGRPIINAVTNKPADHFAAIRLVIVIVPSGFFTTGLRVQFGLLAVVST